MIELYDKYVEGNKESLEEAEARVKFYKLSRKEQNDFIKEWRNLSHPYDGNLEFKNRAIHPIFTGGVKSINSILKAHIDELNEYRPETIEYTNKVKEITSLIRAANLVNKYYKDIQNQFKDNLIKRLDQDNNIIVPSNEIVGYKTTFYPLSTIVFSFLITIDVYYLYRAIFLGRF